jgi:hypothetical protein
VRLKVRDVGVIQSLCCVTVGGYWWNSLVNVNLNFELWLGSPMERIVLDRRSTRTPAPMFLFNLG